MPFHGPVIAVKKRGRGGKRKNKKVDDGHFVHRFLNMLS
jgi:hypothetical protein